MVSREAITALKPVSLEGHPQYDKGEITWAMSDGVKTTIKSQEIVLVAKIPGETHLIVTLTEGGGGGGLPGSSSSNDDQQQQQPAFALSSFLAPSSQVPSELLRARHLVLPEAVPEFLRTGSDASVDVIVSVRSGTGLAQQFYDAALRPLLGILGLTAGDEGVVEKDHTYNVTLTKDADTVKDFARERWGRGKEKKKKETVILLSGDGGIVDLLSGTPPPSSAPGEEEKQDTTSPSSSSHHLPTIVLIPLGTGNALFHSLHKPHYHDNNSSSNNTPSHLVLALRALLQGRPAPLPTFQASFRPAAHPVSGADVSAETDVADMTGAIVASYGFHAQLVWESDTPAYRVHGAKRFGMVAQELLGQSHAYHAVVETETKTSASGPGSDSLGGGAVGKDDISGNDKKKSRNSFNYVLTTLCSNLENTFTISPESQPLDGVLRLVSFGGADGKRTMEIMGAAYDGGKHAGMEGVGYEAVEAVKVTTLEEDARWRKVCIDGAILELSEKGSMTVRRSPGQRLQVVVLDA